jgi:hypothetical protein
LYRLLQYYLSFHVVGNIFPQISFQDW